MHVLFLLFLLLALPLQAQTGDSRLQMLGTGDAARHWQGVGRLNTGGGGFCTATLIAPDRILTAAHCLYDRATGARIADDRMEFLAGWRTGRAEAIRSIRRVAIWPQFDFTAGAALDAVADDLAVLELDRPIHSTSIHPFPLAEAPVATGTEVAVVSYARNRDEAPSIQQTCHVLDERPDGVLLFSCDIDYGSSGAPVLVRLGGEYRIVSLISARVENRQPPLSLGMRLAGRVAVLENTLANPAPGPQGARDSARFLRP